MRFIIHKSSDDANCPHPNAKLDEELTAAQDEIFIDYGDRVYTIEIDTVQELIALAESAHHSIILAPRSCKLINIDMPVIEIYDDYRG